MVRGENRSQVSSGVLTNEEAAVLIEMILANTSTSAPSRVSVPESPQSLTDIFPVAELIGA